MNLSASNVSVQGALVDVSVALPPGSQVLVTGPAGCGKTTLLKALAGLRSLDGGRVEWAGRDASTLSFDERRVQQGRFGMVFQSDALFDSMTVFENVLLPLRRKMEPDAAKAAALEALRSVGLDDAVDTYPERLSGGMRKRTGLARALVAQPEVMLADDPLAGLDPATSRQICSLLASFARGRTVVIAAPEPLPALHFARWIVLRRGEIVHDGPPAPTLLDAPEEISS
ncbi:MAG: ABC transporter ATP-binding protein [Myxococcaceae bacterium]